MSNINSFYTKIFPGFQERLSEEIERTKMTDTISKKAKEVMIKQDESPVVNSLLGDFIDITKETNMSNNSIVNSSVGHFVNIQDSKVEAFDEFATFTVKKLMDLYTKVWNEETKMFDLPEKLFDLAKFTEKLSRHAKQFKKEDIKYDRHFGFIEKFDLSASNKPQIYMRADLHGDLKSLIENLRSLQKEKLLDESFKCEPNVHLVFLGDYCDRGNYGIQILDMLMNLREENPKQVHLIRGNHEYVDTNMRFGYTDYQLMSMTENHEGREALESFYETMSLTTYFSVGEQEHREYVQCTHGLFELTMDPALLLDNPDPTGYLAVARTRNLSERIQKIKKEDRLFKVAQYIKYLVLNHVFDEDLTAYNWGDVTSETSIMGRLGQRQYKLSARDIQCYFYLSSTKHKVKMLFRGHQHKFQHLMYKEEVIATTLPVGMDCPGYQRVFTQPDRAYIIRPEVKVKNWTKRAILRAPGQKQTNEITSEDSLTSSKI